MKVLCLALLAAGALAASPARATCNEKKADAPLSRLLAAQRNNRPDQPVWPLVLSFLREHPQCDDGYFAEGLSDVVCRLLATRWQEAPQVAASMRSRTLRRFVLRHLDSTCDTDDLDAARKNAANSCPAGMAESCNAIVREVGRALKEAEAAVGSNTPARKRD